MKRTFLIRLDDACPTMNVERWDRVEYILNKNSIKPMVGVIPNNEDNNQKIAEFDPNFWDKVAKWEYLGWAIALHGYNHCYTSSEKGMNPMWNRSEFAGLCLDKQKMKIKKGVDIFRSHGINPKYFFAPSHTFDENTLIALRDESDIRIISDTVATKPYLLDDFIFIPQIGGSCRNIPIPGIWTFCIHPNMMSDDDIRVFERFITDNKNKFTSFDSLNLTNVKSKDSLSRLLTFVYFTIRKIRNIK